MSITDKIKKVFTRDKTKEYDKVWNALANTYEGPEELHPNLDINIEYYLSIESQAGKDRYIYDLMMRRRAAREKDRENKL